MGFYVEGSGQRAPRYEDEEQDREEGGRLRPSPGKSSRTHGGGGTLGTPGKVSLTARLAQRIEQLAANVSDATPDERARHATAGALAPTTRTANSDSPPPPSADAVSARPRPVEHGASPRVLDADPGRAQRTRALLPDMAAALGLAPSELTVHVDQSAHHKTSNRGARGVMDRGIVYLDPDAYEPASVAGRRLLAHELVHVAQARLGGHWPGGEAGAAHIHAEIEAETLARSFAAGRALSRPRRSLPADRAAADTGAPTELQGTQVRSFGIAYKPQGVNLRDKPAPSPASKVLRRLPFNTRMFVDSESGGYYLVTTADGDFGYVAKTHVNTNLPEPNAKIYYVQPGDTALGISRKHYGGEAEWGRDHRFFVNGLVHVNQGAGPRGIFKPNPAGDWDQTQVRAGYMIWVPSLAFLRSLQGKVGSGSITYEAWQTVKSAAEAVADFVLGGAAFIAGLLHGALESVWDILVGLKDLAVMAWDVFKSLLAGDLLTDAKGLWDDLQNLDWGKLVQGWVDKFAAKWNQPGLLARWHFRGWVFGYVIAEVLMLVFSGGVIQGIKWVGKSAKVAKVVAKFPRIARFAQAAKDSKAAQRLLRGLSGGGNASKSVKAAKAFVDRLLDAPRSIWNKGPDEIAEAFRKAGFEATIESSTKGSKLSKQIRIKGHKDITNIQVHPGGGRHGGSYYKVSTSNRGKIKVVDRKTYKPTPGEKVTIVYADTETSGWLLRAVAANGAAQRAGRTDDE